MIGYSREEMQTLFTNHFIALIIDDVEKILQDTYALTISQTHPRNFEYRIRRKDGQIIHLYAVTSYDKVHDRFGLVLVDITSKMASLSMLKESARTDEVTKLPTFEKFKELASNMLHTHKESRFRILKIDINDFEVMNHIFGQHESDKLLRLIAKLFNDFGLEKGLLSRIGADEFVVLIDTCTLKNDDYTPVKLREMLYLALEQSIPPMANHKIDFTTGLYKIEAGTTDIEDALNKVTIAHKYAKLNNLTHIAYSDEFKAFSVMQANITNRMEKALLNNEFIPYFQPKYNINTNKIIGAEVLVRWLTDNETLYYPNTFIPVFEKNGFVVNLDMFILESVCKHLRHWLDLSYQCVPISVNFSKIHFSHITFVEDVVAILKRYNIPHELIEIELTETVLVNNKHMLLTLLQKLCDHNFKVAIDDFGTGYSSLSLLKDYSFNILKLDKSFFSKENQSDRENNIIKHIIAMAKSLGMEVIAEGIETIDQVRWLQTSACEIAQGYHFSKPIPADDFRTLLNVPVA